MIELRILHCLDNNRLGEYLFCKDNIDIGKSIETNDIPLPHDSIENHFLKLQIREGQLYAMAHQEGIYFHVNGKKTTGKKLLKRHDRIKVGTTDFEIISFSKEILKSKKEFLNMKVKMLQDNNSEILSLLQSLSDYETKL